METLINSSGKLPQRRLLAARAAGQETLLSDPDTGQVHFLNATAALVWECCDGKTTLTECVQRLRQTFVIPPDVDVAADIKTILTDLQQRGLLPETAPNA